MTSTRVGAGSFGVGGREPLTSHPSPPPDNPSFVPFRPCRSPRGCARSLSRATPALAPRTTCSPCPGGTWSEAASWAEVRAPHEAWARRGRAWDVALPRPCRIGRGAPLPPLLPWNVLGWESRGRLGVLGVSPAAAVRCIYPSRRSRNPTWWEYSRQLTDRQAEARSMPLGAGFGTGP